MPPFLPLWLGVGLAAFVIAVLVGITLGFRAANHQENRGPLQPLPPAPRLQVAPARDLVAYRAAKQQELRQAPVPIDRAMLGAAEQGWGPPK